MKTTKELKELFASGAQDGLLKDIYIDEVLMDYQRRRYVDAISRYEELYGCGFEQVCLSAVQFPPIASSSQNFGETGGRSRDAQLAAVMAGWDARFAGRVTLWYEYPLDSCTGVSTALGALPAQLGVKNLVVGLPAGETQDPAVLADTAARMKELGAVYVVVRDSESGRFY